MSDNESSVNSANLAEPTARAGAGPATAELALPAAARGVLALLALAFCCAAWMLLMGRWTIPGISVGLVIVAVLVLVGGAVLVRDFSLAAALTFSAAMIGVLAIAQYLELVLGGISCVVALGAALVAVFGGGAPAGGDTELS